MLNKEKYAKEIIDAVVNSGGESIGLKDGKPLPCSDINCNKCTLNSFNCHKGFSAWANSEYVEPPVDWSKVPVDTPILVKERDSDKWIKRHFARYENGFVFAWRLGATSWSTEFDDFITAWKDAKLAESE